MKKMTKEEVLRIAGQLHHQLEIIYGDRLKGVYLYGSYARGDAREDSDIDVAVVLSGKVVRAAERRRVSGLASDISLRENCVIVMFFMSENEKADLPYPIHRSISRDGIAV